MIAPCMQVHLFDIDIPGKQRFKESDVLSPGNNLLSFDTGIINPRRACAARVTVLGLCVCYHFFCHRALQCTQQDIPSASVGHEKVFKFGVFFSNASFKSYGMKKPIC